MNGIDILPEKVLLEKPIVIKRFEYSLLGKEFKKQASVETVSKKQYQKFESNKIEENTKSKRSCASLVYNKDFMFYKYHNNKDFAAKQSPDSKLNYLKDVKNKLEEF